MNKGSSVQCAGDIAACDVSTCCEAKATCDSFASCGVDKPVNKGITVQCPGNSASCSVDVCCEAKPTFKSFSYVPEVEATEAGNPPGANTQSQIATSELVLLVLAALALLPIPICIYKRQAVFRYFCGKGSKIDKANTEDLLACVPHPPRDVDDHEVIEPNVKQLAALLPAGDVSPQQYEKLAKQVKDSRQDETRLDPEKKSSVVAASTPVAIAPVSSEPSSPSLEPASPRWTQTVSEPKTWAQNTVIVDDELKGQLIEYCSNHVKMVKASYLFWLRDVGRRLVREQDVPKAAFCTQGDLEQWTSTAQLLVVSHPWWSEQHPDPEGVQLQQVCEFIDHHFKDNKRLHADRMMCPVFFDYLSLPQKKYGLKDRKFMLDRTDLENTRMKSALRDMDLLFAHDDTLVLRLNAPIPKSAPRSAPYSERGWCAFEHRTSLMKRVRGKSIAFHQWREGLVEPSIPHKEPLDFKDELHRLHFSEAGDLLHVADLYEKAFKRQIGSSMHPGSGDMIIEKLDI